MHPADHDHPVSDPLRRLPAPRAPETLLPRVMAFVGAWAARPWYQRAWFTWPVQGQIAAVTLLLLLTAGVFAVWPSVAAGVEDAVSPFRSAIAGDVADAAGQAAVVSTVVGLIGQTLLTTVVPYAVGVVLLMCLACGVCATALNYVASGRTSER